MKRRWFQLHLSTLVALSIVAGLLAWLNVPENFVFGSGVRNAVMSYGRGWPLVFTQREVVIFVSGEQKELTPEAFNYVRLAINGLIALGVMGCVAFVLEYRIRRKLTGMDSE